ELFVEGDRAVVYTASGRGGKKCTYGYDCVFAGDGTSTRIVVLDLADRAEPKIVRQIELSGSLMAARRIGGAVHTVVADADAPGVTATLESRPGAVFASGDALYLSVAHQKRAAKGRWYSFYSSVDEASEIHKFRVGARAKETRYVGSGVVPGHVLNQFAMDEW